VDIDDHGVSRKISRDRAIDESGHGQGVEAFQFDELGFRRNGRCPGRRFRFGPPLNAAGLDIDGVNIERGLRGVQVEAEVAAVFRATSG